MSDKLTRVFHENNKLKFIKNGLKIEFYGVDSSKNQMTRLHTQFCFRSLKTDEFAWTRLFNQTNAVTKCMSSN